MQENKENERVCSISVYDPEDKIEAAVKSKLYEGQILRNQKELFYLIGMDALGLKNLNGGKQNRIALETISQYMRIESVPDSKQKKLIAEIYEYPNYIEKEDNRGKKGFWVDNCTPLFIKWLLNINKNEMIYKTTKVDEISRNIGLVGPKFKKVKIEELQQVDSSFTSAYVRQFYFRCKPELDQTVFNILRKLKNDYSVLNYCENYKIILSDNSSRNSTPEEDIIILKTQKKVLNEFDARRIMTIYQRKQEEKFYKRVCQLINEKLKTNWIAYYNQIEITAYANDLIELYNQLTEKRDAMPVKEDITTKFREKIQRRTEKDVLYNKKQNREKLYEWLKSDNLSENDIAIKEYFELGIFSEDDIIKILYKQNGWFIYYDNYLDIQKEIGEYLLK